MAWTVLIGAVVAAWLVPRAFGSEPPSGAAATQPAGGSAASAPADQADPLAAGQTDEAAKAAARQAAQQEAELRKAIGRHFLHVRMLYNRFLLPAERSDDRAKFEQGRQRLLAINDPLVIPAIIEILSRGGFYARSLMVEALDAFLAEDEATYNLLVITLLDPDERLRRSAAIALLKRLADPRIVVELRRALDTDDEWVLRNAAVALGLLKAREAVPDLINRLSVEVKIEYAIPYDELMLGIGQAYVEGFRVKAARGVALIEPVVNVINSGLALGYQDRPQVEYKTIYRTEVQEALVEISGVNLGFDREAWLDWWARNQ